MSAIVAVLWPPMSRAQDVHVEQALPSANRPVSNAALDARLRETARRARKYAPVPRVAMFDAAYPKDCGEFAAMRGYAVIVVTAVTQDSSELPLGRVYAVTTGGETSLAQLAGIRSGVTATDSVVSLTFGTARYDAIYLLPFAATRAQAELALDFAAHRQGFRLGRFSGRVPAALQACATLTTEPQSPDSASVWSLVQREYPDLGRALRSP